MNILIIGFGFVGKATYLLNNEQINIFVYDINPDLCIPKNIKLEEVVKDVELIFVSLPTPLNIDGTCYTKLIDDVIKNVEHDYIVIRSTIPIGYSDSKRVFFMPEFLTEKDWRNDFINNKYWIFGIYENCTGEKKREFEKRITKLFTYAYNNRSIQYNNLIFCSNKEAELTKLIKNTFLSTKVTYFNEIYDLTDKLNIDYNKVIELVKTDERIGVTHMACPGHDKKRGYGGTCFPKDTNSMYYQLVENNVDTHIFEANLYRNEIIDRPERDWLADKGRTNVKHDNRKVILVTGGAGFLGRHLCAKLLEDPLNQVICLDNLITGKELNIEDFRLNPNFKFLKFDITKKIFLPHVDEVYHLASIASPEKYKKYALDTIMVNFQGTKNVLDLARVHNAKVLLTSTSEVYGDPLIHPQPEDYYGNVNTIGERSCYDESKRLAETLMYEYRRKYGLDTKIVRVFNTYGTFMDEKDGRVITNFLYRMKTNQPLEIYGSGDQTRSFCYVDDTIDGLVRMMNSSEYGPINIGNPYCEITLNELVKLFEKLFNKQLEIKYLSETENDPKCRKPVIDKAISKLSWYPKIGIEEGLRKCISKMFGSEL
jgi:UDP-glucuronate decarboxylase